MLSTQNVLVRIFRYAYSEDGDPTIVAKSNRNIHLGQTTTLSHIDKLKINRLYKCGWYQTYYIPIML